MAFATEINKVLLFDGLLFMVPGLSMFFSPSSHLKMKEKLDSKKAMSVLRDLRRGIGSAYVSTGFFVIMIGYIVNVPNELNYIALFRALSLIVLLLVNLMQIASKRWKIGGPQITNMILYGLLILAYIYFGIIDPL